MEKKYFIAHHGTSKYNSKNILENGLKIKKYSFTSIQLVQVPGDLGEGFYAYHESLENAEKFAAKVNDKKEISVLKMELAVAEDNYLDFDDPDNMKIFEAHRTNDNIRNLEKRFKASKGSKSRECLDGLIIEFALHKMNLSNKVHSISKKTYTPFAGMYRMSHFPNGTELCIRNSAIVQAMEEMEH